MIPPDTWFDNGNVGGGVKIEPRGSMRFVSKLSRAVGSDIRLRDSSELRQHREADSLRQSFDPKPLHHSRAMHLHGANAQSEVKGYRLVRTSGGQGLENLMFSGAESCDQCGRLFGFALALKLAVPFKGRLDGRDQGLMAKRGLDDVHSAGLHRADRRGDIPVSGDDDDRKVNLHVVELALKRESIRRRHPNLYERAASEQLRRSCQ